MIWIEKKDVIEAISNEPELPGPIPEEMYQAIMHGDRDTVAEAMRIVVRVTKRNLIRYFEERY
jgi:hypothetical protein